MTRARLRYRRLAAGFTLVESALVLVIAGLVLGGVMQGGALIDAARARALTNDLESIQAAWLAFEARYQALPGDFALASTHISELARGGNGNGRIDTAGERAGLWQQLALSGLIKGQYDGQSGRIGSTGDTACASSTCPANPFNGYFKLAYGRQATGEGGAGHELFTGAQVPVGVLARIDRTLDDGRPDTGRIRAHRNYASACTRAGEWYVAGGEADCAGVLRP